MNMDLDYQFEYNGKTYEGIDVWIGDTIDLESEAKDVKSLKESAICHEFDLKFGYEEDEKKIAEIFANAHFKWCELRV